MKTLDYVLLAVALGVAGYFVWTAHKNKQEEQGGGAMAPVNNGPNYGALATQGIDLGIKIGGLFGRKKRARENGYGNSSSLNDGSGPTSFGGINTQDFGGPNPFNTPHRNLYPL